MVRNTITSSVKLRATSTRTINLSSHIISHMQEIQILRHCMYCLFTLYASIACISACKPDRETLHSETQRYSASIVESRVKSKFQWLPHLTVINDHSSININNVIRSKVIYKDPFTLLRLLRSPHVPIIYQVKFRKVRQSLSPSEAPWH